VTIRGFERNDIFFSDFCDRYDVGKETTAEPELEFTAVVFRSSSYL
jgi:hypothetical protein